MICQMRSSCRVTHGCKKIQSKQTCTKLLVQIATACGRRSGKGTNHYIGPGGDELYQVNTHMTKPACDSMTSHRRPDSLTHDKSESRTATTHQLVCLRMV